MSYHKVLVYFVFIETYYDFNDFGLKYSFEPDNISFLWLLSTSTIISAIVLHLFFFRVILTRYGVWLGSPTLTLWEQS